MSARVQQSGVELGSVTTNANGNYSLVLTSVEIGSTVLLGLGGRDEGWLEQNAAGSVSIGSSGTVVVNLTEIAASLSTVQGRVTQANGDPIAGLSVWVTSPSSFSIEAVTDADGNYSATLTNVTPGTQFYVTAGGPRTTWPMSVQWVSAPSFNRTAIINIVLSPFLSTRLTIVVNDTNHHLVSGALVSLALSGSLASFLTNDPYLASTCTTNASGTCSLDAPSDFGSAIAQGNLTLTVSASLGGAVIGTALWDGMTATTSINPPPPASLSTVQGRVTQANGDPIAGLSVWVTSPSSFSIEAVTDADGNYSATLTNVTPGTQFYVTAGGPRTTWPMSVQWVSAPSFNRTAIINIVLSPFLSTRLTIVVNDTNHHLVSGALVSLALSGSLASFLTNDPYLASTCTTNASGTCSLDAPSDFGSAIAQGNLTLTVSASLGGAVIGTALWDGSRKSQLIDAGIITSTSVPAGTLSVVSTVGKAITRLSVSQSVATLPSGVTTALGAISYVITGLDIGASTNVSFYLPSSSSGTNGLFKKIGGTWVDLAPYCVFDGQRVTLSVTDGGVLDADGLANGIVVDPVVPVRIASKALFRLALSTASSAVKRGAKVSIKVSFVNFQHPGVTAVKLYDNGILLGTVSVKAGSGVWSGSLQKVGKRTITASISTRGFPTVVSSMARITVSK